MRTGTKRVRAEKIEAPVEETPKPETPKALDVARTLTAEVIAEVMAGIEIEGARLHVALAPNEPVVEGDKVELWFAATKNSGRTLVGRFRSELAVGEPIEAEHTRIAASATRWVARYKD